MSNHRIFDGLMNLFISANLNHSIADKQQQHQDELWILLVLTIFLNYQKPNVRFFFEIIIFEISLIFHSFNIDKSIHDKIINR